MAPDAEGRRYLSWPQSFSFVLLGLRTTHQDEFTANPAEMVYGVNLRLLANPVLDREKSEVPMACCVCSGMRFQNYEPFRFPGVQCRRSTSPATSRRARRLLLWWTLLGSGCTLHLRVPLKFWRSERSLSSSTSGPSPNRSSCQE